MEISITFKNVNPSEEIKKYLSRKFNKLKKMINYPESVNAVFRLEKSRCILDVSLLSKKINIHATDEGTTFNEAVDLVVEKVKKQLVKIKEKIEDHR